MPNVEGSQLRLKTFNILENDFEVQSVLVFVV